MEAISDKLIKNFFGFTDKIGEGSELQVQVMHDKIKDGGTNYIAVGRIEVKTFTKSLQDLSQSPESFSFEIYGHVIEAKLGIDIQSQQMTLKIFGHPYD